MEFYRKNVERLRENAKKKTHYNHLGPLTYETGRKKLIEKGLYPTTTIASSSSASSSVVTSLVNRANDWWCSMHGLDQSRKYIIKVPRQKKVADSLLEGAT